ncbi:POK9 protein, partial [Spizaetus tyrannus]|nr:POK9 protein [Spizaetus tyrannus]
ASSARVDLATSAETIISDTSVALIPTGTCGPLGHGMAALLIRRSSTTLRGLFVLPGIIDADYEGEIKIMAWTPVPLCTIPAGSKIAQLVYFSPQTPNASQVVRGTGCFGSTRMPEIYWTQQLTMSRLQLCTLQAGGTRLAIRGIIDSGADVTVIP